MPRPNRDRVMVSFYLARRHEAEITERAAERGETKADTYRTLLTYALAKMPAGWRPRKEQP